MNWIIKGGEIHQNAIKEIVIKLVEMGVPMSDANILAEELPTAIMDADSNGLIMFTGSLTQTIKLMAKSYKLVNKTPSPEVPEVLKNLLRDLDAIGFDDEDASVQGSDCVDVVCNHIDQLRKLTDKRRTPSTPARFKNEFELCGGDLERQEECTDEINDLIKKITSTPAEIAIFGSEMNDTLNNYMDVGAGDSEPRNHILDKVEKLFKKNLDNMQGLF